MRPARKQGAKVSLAGIALGMAGASAVMQSLASGLYGTSPMDPVTYAAVAMVMAVVTLLACYVPTRRAMQVGPVQALRYE
jgi:ABC-type antimicrobial peptide transport system permease subunit